MHNLPDNDDNELEEFYQDLFTFEDAYEPADPFWREAAKNELDMLPRHEAWEHAAHYEKEKQFLLLRNVLAGVTALLFLLSLLPLAVLEHAAYAMKGVAYLSGAGAYVAEILVLTDGLRRKEPAKEMFMPYVFAGLYPLLALSYFIH